MKFLILWMAVAQILPMEGFRGYAIYGIVYLPDGSTARRATVRIGSTSGLERRIFVDNNGRYEFRDIPVGRYTISASNPDDQDMVSPLVEVDTSRSASNKIQVAVYLRYPVDKTSQIPAKPLISVRQAAVPKRALKAFEQGQKYGARGNLDRALESFTSAVEAYPEYAEALAERGNVLLAAGRVPEAAADFARALAIDPQCAPALRGSGICKFEQRKYDEAVRDLENAAAADPGAAKTFMFLGLVQMALERRVDARASFERALSLDPQGSARAHVHLANLYIGDNNAPAGIRELETYLTKSPNAPDGPRIRELLQKLRQKLL